MALRLQLPSNGVIYRTKAPVRRIVSVCAQGGQESRPDHGKEIEVPTHFTTHLPALSLFLDPTTKNSPSWFDEYIFLILLIMMHQRVLHSLAIIFPTRLLPANPRRQVLVQTLTYGPPPLLWSV